MCAQAETDLYSKSGALVQLLGEWRSGADTLPARLEALVIELYERQYIGLQVRASERKPTQRAFGAAAAHPALQTQHALPALGTVA
jgi:hypothetical protein